MARGRTYRGREPDGRLHNLKVEPDVWDIVRRLCTSRKMTQWEVMQKYAKPALQVALRKAVREELAAIGEG